VLAQEVRAERYEIEPIVREALERVGGSGEVVVRLNAEDLARGGLADPGDDGRIKYVADPSVRPAGCIVETTDGLVVATIEDGLAAAAEALRSPT
jgi:flagellar biosynthesis/type III secretory pathway protein FliH